MIVSIGPYLWRIELANGWIDEMGAKVLTITASLATVSYGLVRPARYNVIAL